MRVRHGVPDVKMDVFRDTHTADPEHRLSGLEPHDKKSRVRVRVVCLRRGVVFTQSRPKPCCIPSFRICHVEVGEATGFVL